MSSGNWVLLNLTKSRSCCLCPLLAVSVLYFEKKIRNRLLEYLKICQLSTFQIAFLMWNQKHCIITPNQKVIFFEFGWPAGQQLSLFCYKICKSLNFKISFQNTGGVDCTLCKCDTDDCNGVDNNGASMSQISIVGFIAVLLLSFMNQ